VSDKSVIDTIIDRFLPHDVIGVDIGTAYVKLVKLKKSGSSFSLDAVEALPIPNPADAAETEDSLIPNREGVRAKILEAFEKIGIAENRIPLVTSVGGKSVVIKRIYLNLEGLSDEEVLDTLYSEAEQYIPYDISDCEMRFVPIDGALDDMKREPYLLISAKKDIVADYTNLLVEIGGKVDCVDSDVIATNNMFEYNYSDELDGVVALIDIGATSTNVNIMVDGAPFFNREIIKGGIALSETIASKLSMNFDEAENLKIGDTIPEDLTEIIRELCEEVLVGVQQSFEFFSSTNPEMGIERIFITGGSSKLRGLREIIESQLGIPTEYVDPFRKVKIPSRFDEEEIEALRHLVGVAVGLAMRERDDWADSHQIYEEREVESHD